MSHTLLAVPAAFAVRHPKTSDKAYWVGQRSRRFDEENADKNPSHQQGFQPQGFEVFEFVPLLTPGIHLSTNA